MTRAERDFKVGLASGMLGTPLRVLSPEAIAGAATGQAARAAGREVLRAGVASFFGVPNTYLGPTPPASMVAVRGLPVKGLRVEACTECGRPKVQPLRLVV